MRVYVTSLHEHQQTELGIPGVHYSDGFVISAAGKPDMPNLAFLGMSSDSRQISCDFAIALFVH
jgi:hypothetical protein